MAVSSLVAASSGKTMYRITLTSGTSWTVPAGVTYVNVILYGGGGGSGGHNPRTGGAGAGGTGGTTTFTGATSALGGTGGIAADYNLGYATGYYGGSASSPTNNTGLGAKGSWIHNNSASMGIHPAPSAIEGYSGQIVSSTLSTTPGASIAYSIGAGGTAGSSGASGEYKLSGVAGASGKIDIEYWV